MIDSVYVRSQNSLSLLEMSLEDSTQRLPSQLEEAPETETPLSQQLREQLHPGRLQPQRHVGKLNQFEEEAAEVDAVGAGQSILQRQISVVQLTHKQRHRHKQTDKTSE